MISDFSDVFIYICVDRCQEVSVANRSSGQKRYDSSTSKDIGLAKAFDNQALPMIGMPQQIYPHCHEPPIISSWRFDRHEHC